MGPSTRSMDKASSSTANSLMKTIVDSVVLQALEGLD